MIKLNCFYKTSLGKLQWKNKQYGPKDKFSTIYLCQMKEERTQKASDSDYN